MPRRVSYRIADRPDGLFDVIATIEPDKVFRREGLASRAEVDAWIDGLRMLMAAIGAPVAQDDTVAGRPSRAPDGEALSRAAPENGD